MLVVLANCKINVFAGWSMRFSGTFRVKQRHHHLNGIYIQIIEHIYVPNGQTDGVSRKSPDILLSNLMSMMQTVSFASFPEASEFVRGRAMDLQSFLAVV